MKVIIYRPFGFKLIVDSINEIKREQYEGFYKYAEGVMKRFIQTKWLEFE